MKCKSKLLLLAMLWPAVTLIAQEKGMQFFEGSWSELLAEAKRTNKPIFVDVYTVWCGPCKLMAKNIFPLEEVGNKYNPAFLNYKLDAEKGEGVQVGESFNVKSYPTYLYLNSAGELVYRGGGYSGTPGPFLNDADKALQAAKDPNTIGKNQQAWNAGERNMDFLRQYIAKLTLLEMDNDAPLEEYFSKLSASERIADTQLVFLAANVKHANTPLFAHLMNNLDVLKKTKQEVTGPGGFILPMEYKLTQVLQMSAMKAARDQEYDKLITCIRYADKIPVTVPYLVTEFTKLKMEYYGATGKPDSLVTIAQAFVKPITILSVQEIRTENDRIFEQWYERYRTGQSDSTSDESFAKTREYFSQQYISSTANDLFFAASAYADHVQDKALLKQALAWNEKAIVLMPAAEYLQITSAKLLHKLGSKSKAKARIQPLIDKAKKAGEEKAVNNYEKLLQSMK